MKHTAPRRGSRSAVIVMAFAALAVSASASAAAQAAGQGTEQGARPANTGVLAFGWLAQLSGSCWKSEGINQDGSAMEVCYWLDAPAGLLRVQRIDRGASAGETTLKPMAGERGWLEERSYDGACRMRPNVLMYERRNLRAELVKYDDATEGERLIGMYTNTWRRLDADRFERGVRALMFGSEQVTSRNWVFTRSRGYQVVGPSQCAKADTAPFPPELRGGGTASAR